MTAFAFLSALARAFFALWALLLCLTNIGSAVLATVKKRFRLSVIATVFFAPSFFLWQVIFDYSLFGGTNKAAEITSTLCSLGWAYWLVLFLLLSVASAYLLGYNIRYDKTFITTGTIKLYLDKMPCGVCCWRKNGRVLFSNNCMNELCIALTDNPLLNGNQFKEALKGDIFTVDGKVWHFASREIELDGESLWEMVASNITAEYAKTQVLEKDKEELSRLNKELRDYYSSIDESVERQEVLQAKMNIHDEMNRLMLSTAAAGEDTQALDKIFSLWEQNALLLCMEADRNASENQASALESLAEALSVNLTWCDYLPENLGEKQKELFFFTAKEALVNAVKHAGAKNMEISFKQGKDTLECFFTNDGTLPTREVNFEGGLANIALLAQKQGADVSVESTDKFTLILKFHTIG